jgi:uncharacterized protein YjbI with pentapeptide repeats
MAVTPDSFTEDRLSRRLGVAPRRLPSGAYDLAGVNLSRLSLTKAQLAGANLRAAILRGADLQRAALTEACLAAADLAEARLQEADLSRADLRGADLRRAVLDGTALRGACFDKARWDGARLRSVRLWQAGIEPDEVAAAEVELAGLLAIEPEPDDVEPLLAWCARLGGQPDLWALRQALAERPWRPWRAALRQALSQLEARLGALSEASLSRADPTRLDSRSLSRADDPASQPAGASLSWLKRWKAGQVDVPED